MRMFPRWISLLFLVAAVASAFWLHAWVEALGGPTALVARYGYGGSVVVAALQLVLCVFTPLPTEVFTVASAATYGMLPALLLTWAAWTAGSMVQYTLARRGAASVEIDQRLARVPRRLRRFPIGHPVFLIAGRWLPMGFHVVNLAAGVSGVPLLRQLWTAAVGSFPVALFWALIGAGIQWF